MSLSEDLARAAEHAVRHAEPGDAVSAVLATEPRAGERVYLCALDAHDGYRSWIAVREDGAAVTDRRELREAVSIAALCEVAGDAAGGGDVAALLASLAALREAEAPEGIAEAEEAARALGLVLGDPPRIASPARLDEIGAAARRLERELDPLAASPFTVALQSAQGAVAELQREIEAGYRLPLS